jgi:hypothetical protein
MEMPIATVIAIPHDTFPSNAPTPTIQMASVARPRPILPGMAGADDLKSSGGNPVWIQFPPPVFGLSRSSER